MRIARRKSGFDELQARIAATVDWSFEHYKSVHPHMLSAVLRAIHFCHNGEGQSELLLQLTDRTQALMTKDPHANWAIFFARLLLSLSDQARYVDHVSGLTRICDTRLCRLMARVADRWRSDKYPDYAAEKVFCIGLSRTGTKSLDSALTILGYDAAHWFNPITQNVLGRQDYFLFEGFSDITVSADLQWLRENFSNARYILTERDLASWERSITRHYFDHAGVTRLDQLSSKGASRFSGRADAAEAALYGGFNTWSNAHNAHNYTVDEVFSTAQDRLLKMNIVGGDSWEKICDFLGKAYPRVNFPHNP